MNPINISNEFSKSLSEVIMESDKKVRESSQILQSILETTLDGFWCVDNQGNLIDVNLAYCQLSGYTREELLEMQISQLDAIDSTLKIEERMKMIIDQKHIQFETKHRRKDGSCWDVEISITYFDIAGGRFYSFLRDITKRKNMEIALQESEQFLKQSQSNAGIGSYSLDMTTMFWKSSDTLDEIFGIHPDYEHSLNGWINLIHPNDREMMSTYMQENIINQHQKFDREYRIIRQNDQTEHWIHGLGKLEFDAINHPIKMVGTIQDITERKHSEEKLHLAANVFTHANEGIVITSPDGIIMDVNDAFTHTTGYERDEIIGQNPRILSSKLQSKEFYSAMWNALSEKGYWYGELWNRRKNGELYAEMLTITSILDSKGNIQNYVGLFSDITSEKEHEQQLERIAHYDTLTGLPNRVLNSDMLRHVMFQAVRRNEQIAVLYIDLDGFKEVNDQYGHDVGDKLLIALSLKMKQTLREGDTLSRLGGDEFVVILRNMADIFAASPIIKRLLDAASQTIELDNVLVQVSASIGVTFYPQNNDVDADQLVRQADQAMYEAKQAGKKRYHIFDSEDDRTIRTRHEKLERLHLALVNNEFVLHYQPKVNMHTGELIGAEALIRWQHPEKGLIPPLEFLPIIENHPLAIEVGEWVIKEAISQIERWKIQGLNLPVSVNVGARQLLQGDFFQRLNAILSEYKNFDTTLLEIEILETSALEDVNQASQIIEKCKIMEIYFSLDDFGTGYSSLTYLKKLPVRTLKIDQSFVRDMLNNRDDLAILEGIISLAKAFNREVLAEGVETYEHGKQLLLLGCDLAQGYGIARPMPSDEMIEWVQKWDKNHEWIA
ncbi:sensor domain-containing protein [Sulfuricurvum sp.]|uniref:sensor domain-containing protein n=1 Tax=Sulfuricurvum sp. TaxID=2025608 RepID=UPI003BB682BB